MRKEKKQKVEPYRIVMTRFIGDNNNFTYEITFNKSLVHTGKYSAIEKALNAYDKKEPFNNFSNHIEAAFSSLWYGICSFFQH